MKLKHSVLLFLSSLLIIGCGLKGDLYTPEDPPVVVNESSVFVEKSTEPQTEIEEAVEESQVETEEKDELHFQPIQPNTTK